MKKSDNTKTRYDFKMFLENILVFRAYLIDEKTFYFIKVSDFDIDESYKQLFLEIIKGDFILKYYLTKDLENRKLLTEPKVKLLESSNVIERIEESEKVLNTLFGLTVSCEEAKLNNMIAFRYDGHDLNIDYGLNPKSAGDVFSITNQLFKTIQSNNTDFGEVLQMKEIASSTVIPFQSEKIDLEALNILKRVLKDINLKTIDSKFANSQHKYAALYKNFIKQLKMLRRIKDLTTFQIIIDNKPYDIKDLDLLKEIDDQLYKDEVSGIAKIHHLEKYLSSAPNLYSVVVVYNGNRIRFHLDKKLANFEQMLRIIKENDEKNVSFKGYKSSEEVILVSEIYKV